MQNTSGRTQLKTAYSLLYTHFGPQGWWPVYSDGGIGYHPGDFSLPGTETQKLEIAFGAILTQQASWKNAEKALKSMIGKGLISPYAVLETPEEEMHAIIRSSGYFRQKTMKLKAFSRFLIEKYGGSMVALFSEEPDIIRKDLLSIRGIGKETADSIMLYAGNIPSFVIDAYTFRIAERLGISADRDYDALKEAFESSIERDYRIYNEYHALIVELGKSHCHKGVPNCESCPLSRICPYHKKL